MNGMGRGVSLRNETVTAHFVSALFFDLAILIGLCAIVVTVTQVALRGRDQSPSDGAEQPARRLLRLGTGSLWVVAGVLQLQTSMPMGLPTAVVRPSVASAPNWVSWSALHATDDWIRHPILGASGVVWLQLGLGLWLILARRGLLSRAAGAASAVWALLVFVVGSGLGGAFIAPWSWVFGAPGASLLYAAAGVLIAMPPSRLASARVARAVGVVFGAVLIAFAIVQALPSGGFLRSGRSSAFATMADQMAALSQPGGTAALQRAFATAASHAGPVMGLVIIIVLLVTGLALLSGRPRVVTPAAVGFSLVAMIVWVFAQDFGVMGGVATDVNSMPMWVVMIVATSLLVRDASNPSPAVSAPPVSGSAGARQAAAAGAVAMTGFGAILLLGVALLSGSTADAAIAAGAQVSTLRGPAPAFTLTDSHGHPVALADLRGHVVVLSFIDPVCTSECPIEAQEMRRAAQQLGADAPVTFVAVNANPRFISPQDLRTFNDAEGLTRWRNWTYLTGSVAQLRNVWTRYGVSVSTIGAGGMALHSEPVFIIDRAGHLRATWTLAAGEGPSSLEGQSTTAQLVDEVRRAL